MFEYAVLVDGKEFAGINGRYTFRSEAAANTVREMYVDTDKEHAYLIVRLTIA